MDESQLTEDEARLFAVTVMNVLESKEYRLMGGDAMNATLHAKLSAFQQHRSLSNDEWSLTERALAFAIGQEGPKEAKALATILGKLQNLSRRP